MDYSYSMPELAVDGEVSLFRSECADVCMETARTCAETADACLSVDDLVPLTQCIRLNLACAGICGSVGRILSRTNPPDAGILRASLDACVLACVICGAESRANAGRVDECRLGAEACRRCEEACSALLTDLAPVPA